MVPCALYYLSTLPAPAIAYVGYQTVWVYDIRLRRCGYDATVWLAFLRSARAEVVIFSVYALYGARRKMGWRLAAFLLCK